jgi:CBS domain-containing protein
MKARDVMASPVITVKLSASVQEVAKILLERRISAVPVVDEHGKIVGIVSEGDLMHCAEAGTERKHAWWLRGFIGDETLATEYVEAHARKVVDVMTRDVISATPDSPLHEIAALMETNAIKRVPIVKDGYLVGLVSRANLIQAVASGRKVLDIPISDTVIRDKIMAALKAEAWAHTGLLNITVNNGVVDICGTTGSEAERKAIRVAAESTPSVSVGKDNMIKRSMEAWT